MIREDLKRLTNLTIKVPEKKVDLIKFTSSLPIINKKKMKAFEG